MNMYMWLDDDDLMILTDGRMRSEKREENERERNKWLISEQKVYRKIRSVHVRTNLCVRERERGGIWLNTCIHEMYNQIFKIHILNAILVQKKLNLNFTKINSQ